MSARVSAPHENTYRTPRFANQPMIDLLKNLLTAHELYTGHFDRLWKMLEAHEIDVRTPGDGTKIPLSTGMDAIDWVKGYIARHNLQPKSAITAPVASERSAAPTAVKYGVYRYDGDVYIVVESKKNTDRTYAKRMQESPPRLTARGEEVDFEWVYAPGIIWKLTEEHRMTLDDARDLMIRYGRCLKCRHPLKAAKTLQTAEETGVMVGPVCRKYFS
jgi:hypothetical protein